MSKVNAKQQTVEEIKDKLDKAVSVVIVSSKGLTVEQDTRLRKELRDASIDYKVYKNTLFERAIEGGPFETLKDHLKGPSAFALSYEEPTKAAALIAKLMKDMKLLEFKASYIENSLYDAEATKTIANIPSREVLLSKLLGSFQSPMASFARLIQAVADEQAVEA